MSIVAEARKLLKNAKYADGYAQVLTQDCEALTAALKKAKALLDSAPLQSFDVAVCEKLRDVYLDIFLRHPEVKCLATSITWNGDLNDAKIQHGLWLDRNGMVGTPEGVMTGIEQTIKMLTEQVNRGLGLIKHMQEQVMTLGNEIAARIRERDAIKPSTGEQP